MDKLIKKYADRLQEMYDDRTAGEASMSGILSEFLEGIVDSCELSEEIILRHDRYKHPEEGR